MSYLEPAQAGTLTQPPLADAACPSLSVVIVSYNCRRLILDCLNSLNESTAMPDFEVIVVDNASSDGSVEMIAAEFPRVRLVELDRNIGFGRGCNEGARQAKGRLLMLLNPDTVVLPGTVDKLVRFAADHPHARIWGGRTLDSSGRIVPGAYWRFPTVWSTFCVVSGLARTFPDSDLFNREAYGGRRESVLEAEVVSGCLFLIEKSLWDALAGFDPRYFMYSEEVDLCLRARRLGARPMVSAEAEIVHEGGQTQKVRSDRLVRMLKGKRTYMLQHWSSTRRCVGGLLLLSWPWSRYAALSLACALVSRPGWQKLAAVWGDVWRRRRDWMAGYASVPR